MAYLAYGVAFSSDLALGVPTVEQRPELVIARRPDAVDPATVEPLDTGPDDWCDAGRLGSGWYLSFADEAEFVVSADGSTIGWHSFGDPSPTLTHLLLDHVLPRALTRRGRAVLHGSCLSPSDGSCYAILGQSGMGKSTLAAALVASGHRFLADDCVVIELHGHRPTAAPAYPELRLSHESREMVDLERLVEVGEVTTDGDKRRMALPDRGTDIVGPQRLRAAFVLTPDADRAGTRSSRRSVGRPHGPARATIELLGHSFHLNQGDERTAVLDRFTTIALGCEVRSLTYEHSSAGLAAAVADITATLTGGEGDRRMGPGTG